jgi:hypothetical protein
MDEDVYQRLKKLVSMNAKKYEGTAAELRKIWEDMND